MTNNGKALILYSLKNAIRELHDLDGFQPHRSFWVNRAYVDSVKKRGREGLLTLRTGDKIPVSRTRMKELSHTLEKAFAETS